MAWIKLHTDILDDIKKTRKLSPNSFQIFIFLMLFAKELEVSGEINLDFNDIKWRLRVDEEQLKKGIEDLIQMNILSNKHKTLKFTNWIKRQFSESYERVTKHRQMKRYSNATCNDDVTPRARENRTEQNRTDKKKKDMRNSDESHISLRRWFDEVMWPSVPKKKTKDPTWKEVQKLKPDEDTRTRIVEYFKSYPSIAATYPPGEFFPPMQDPVRVIKHKRYLDVLAPYESDANGSAPPRPKMVYITQESFEAALARGETNIELRVPEDRNV